MGFRFIIRLSAFSALLGLAACGGQQSDSELKAGGAITLANGTVLQTGEKWIEFKTPASSEPGNFGYVDGPVRRAGIFGNAKIEDGCLVYGPYVTLPTAGTVTASIEVNAWGVLGSDPFTAPAFTVDLVSTPGPGPAETNLADPFMVQLGAFHDGGTSTLPIKDFDQVMTLTGHTTGAERKVELRVCHVAHDLIGITVGAQDIRLDY